MKIKSSGRARLGLITLTSLAALSSVAAQAGEISLFESAGFGGRQVTFRGPASSVNNVGFNDRTSSMVVRSGRWEVCSDDNFKGDCAVFEPGQYASIDGRFSKRVSSLREIGVVAGVAAPVAGFGSVDLYGQPRFHGRTARVDRDASNFNTFNFNDRASSLVVQGGSWEVCTDADYRGTCRTFAPGRYPSLGYGMTKAISSARPVINQEDSRAQHGGGWNRDHREEASNPIVLFGEDGIRGRSVAIANDIPDLTTANFNDSAQSLVIEDGYWEFCSDSYYRGQCRVLGPGQYPRMEPILYRTVSSIRAASRDTRDEQRNQADRDRDNQNGRGNQQLRGDVELFTGANFSGTRYPVGHDMTTFDQGGFNDKIGSVIVNSGQWEMCVDANYRGSCSVFGPGRYAGLGGMTNQLSSIRRVN